MKKRLISLILAVMMLCALAIPAFAEDPKTTTTTPNGKVTITNAVPGVSYTLYKGFDATYSTSTGTDGKEVKNVSYYIDTTKGTTEDQTKAKALVAAILDQRDETGYDKDGKAKPAPVCSFALVMVSEGVYEVTQKKDFPEASGVGWLATQKANLKKVETIKAETEDVVFEKLEYGYYLMENSNTSDVIITVDTAAPEVEIIDKNPRTPDKPEKTVEEYSQEIGKNATFTVEQKTVNQRTSLKQTARVMNYTFTDTAKSGLDYLSTTKDTIFGDKDGTIEIYTGYDETTKKYTGKIENFDKNITVPTVVKKGDPAVDVTYYPTIDYTYDPTTHTLSVIWGDAVMDKDDATKQIDTTSRYPDNAYIVLTYDMVIDDTAYVKNDEDDYKEVVSDNQIDTYMKVDGNPKLENIGTDTAKVYSLGLSIRKYDEKNNKLTGAQFVLYKTGTKTVPDTSEGAAEGATKTVETKLYWKWDATNNTLTWTEDTYGDDQIKEADNLTTTAEFYGLAEGTYYLKEIMAPDGYKTPEDPFTVVVAKNDAHTETDDQYFTATVAGTATEYNTGRGIYSTTITNYAGSSLPTTGGMGTTIFYIVGSVMFLGGCILLITKKRMENNT